MKSNQEEVTAKKIHNRWHIVSTGEETAAKKSHMKMNEIVAQKKRRWNFWMECVFVCEKTENPNL